MNIKALKQEPLCTLQQYTLNKHGSLLGAARFCPQVGSAAHRSVTISRVWKDSCFMIDGCRIGDMEMIGYLRPGEHGFL